LGRSYFHLHLVSDSTGETLITVARAVVAQYEGVSAIEHVYPLVRSPTQLQRVLAEIEAAPGIVLYTLVDPELSGPLEEVCRQTRLASLSVLSPVHSLLQSYLGAAVDRAARRAAHAERGVLQAHRRHELHAHARRRAIARRPRRGRRGAGGISRTSKTPTAIYLANRGPQDRQLPARAGVQPPAALEQARKPLVVGLIASPERIVQIRQNRLLSLRADDNTAYVDRRPSPTRSPIRGACARATNGRSST
jgi:regulator of PEP synthase PpsR (kinase-PPPase family)